MGRPTKEELNKKRTKATIIKALQQNEVIGKTGKEKQYLLDQVEQYMQFFDDLEAINSRIKEEFDPDLIKEKRQITKEMRNILTFLGLKPSVGLGSGEPEEL